MARLLLLSSLLVAVGRPDPGLRPAGPPAGSLDDDDDGAAAAPFADDTTANAPIATGGGLAWPAIPVLAPSLPHPPGPRAVDAPLVRRLSPPHDPRPLLAIAPKTSPPLARW
jgi:hypothetical protein